MQFPNLSEGAVSLSGLILQRGVSQRLERLVQRIFLRLLATVSQQEERVGDYDVGEREFRQVGRPVIAEGAPHPLQQTAEAFFLCFLNFFLTFGESSIFGKR